MNKQITKGYKMRKVAMIVSLLAVLGTSVQAGYWYHTPSYGGGWSSTYYGTPSYSWKTNRYGYNY